MSLERCDARALRAFAGSRVAGCVEALACPQLTSLSVLGALALPRLPDTGAPRADEPCTELWLATGGGWPYARPSPPEDARVYTPPDDAPALGETCVNHEQACQQGAYCRVTLPLRQSGWSFCGVCQEYLGLGAPCEARDHCSGGLCLEGYCRELALDGESCVLAEQCPFGACLDGVCRSSLGRLARTDGAALGEPCRNERRSCGDDITLACVEGRCVARPDQGDACDDDRDCRVLQHCQGGRCAAAQCQTLNFPCPQCGRGQYCDVPAGACLPTPHLGQPCSSACAAGLVCDTHSGVCVRRRANGRSCSEDRQCQSGMCLRDLLPYCDPTTGRPCSVPACDDCGVCGEDTGVSACRK